MTVTTISSREFKQDKGGAKNTSRNGPVIITDRGRPTHVLLTIEEYRRITGGDRKIADLLAMPGSDAVELEIPGWGEVPRPADLA